MKECKGFFRDDFQAACVVSVGRCDVKVSEHDVRGQICAMAFSAANPLLPSTPTVLHAARWWPKASSGANSEGQKQKKAAKQEDPIRFRTHLHSMDWQCREWHGSKRATLRSHKSTLVWRQPWPEHMVSVVFVDRLGCVFLPSMTHLTRLSFGITCLGPQPFRKCFPWRCDDAHLPQTSARLLHDFHVPQTDGHSVDDVLRAPRMSLLDHLQTICPTTPMSSVLDFRTKPPKVKGKEATSWEWGSNSSTCKILLRHCNTLPL